MGNADDDRARHVVLLGPTASGKTALVLTLAEARAEAELVAVDSMSVYRHLDIGTSKPSRQQLSRFPHHLVDLTDPEQQFSLGEFQAAAREALHEIEGRGHRALLVAGTALYMRVIVDDLEIPGRWPELRLQLEEQSDRAGGLELLYGKLQSLDPSAAARIDPGNKRRIVRGLEVTMGSGRRFSSFGPGLGHHPPTRFVMVGLPFDPSVHDARIEERFRRMLEDGLLDEVRTLAAWPSGISRTARQALGYREMLSHLEDGVPFEEAASEAVSRTKSFARRQWRWFRRDPRITWLDPHRDPLVQLLALWDATASCSVGD